MIIWNIETLEHNTVDGLVITSHWRCTAKDGDLLTSAYGTVSLPVKDPTDPTFVPYQNITEAQAIEWTKAVIGKEQVDVIEENVNKQLLSQKEPKTTNGTPWSTI